MDRPPQRKVLILACSLGLRQSVVAAADQDLRACLLWNGNSCSSIRDRDVCLSSREGGLWAEWKGVPYYGEPCTWCDGKECPNTDGHLCAVWPVVAGNTTANSTAAFTAASCPGGAASAPLVELPTPGAKLDATFVPASPGPGEPAPKGPMSKDAACRANSVTDERRPNNNYYWTFTANSLEQCQAFCLAREACTGVEYHAESSYCEVWWHEIKWTQHEPGYQCYRVLLANASKPGGNSNRKCLRWEMGVGGCLGIADRETCLTSRDGRGAVETGGVRVHGEPCAWCDGDLCADPSKGNFTRCGPLSWYQAQVGGEPFKGSDSLQKEAILNSLAVAMCESGAPKSGGSTGTEAALSPPATSAPACFGEVYLHLTTLGTSADKGDLTIQVQDGSSLIPGEDLIVSSLHGDPLDENADMEEILSKLATEGHPVTANRVAKLTSTNGTLTVIELASELNQSFPRGAYVASHACKADVAAAPRPPALGASQEPEPTCLINAFGMRALCFSTTASVLLAMGVSALVVGCAILLAGAVSKAKSKDRSVRNATRRTRKVDAFDDDDDEEEMEPMLPKQEAAPMAPFGGDPRLLPRALTVPPLQVINPFGMLPMPAPIITTMQPQYTAVRTSQPVAIQPVVRTVVSPRFAEPFTASAGAMA